jgi:hypothetical protein
VNDEITGRRSGPDLQQGDKVKLVTTDPMIAHYGRGVDVPEDLKIGEVYEIYEVEVHSEHTLIWVTDPTATIHLGYPYGPFNEALFEHQP